MKPHKIKVCQLTDKPIEAEVKHTILDIYYMDKEKRPTSGIAKSDLGYVYFWACNKPDCKQCKTRQHRAINGFMLVPEKGYFRYPNKRTKERKNKMSLYNDIRNTCKKNNFTTDFIIEDMVSDFISKMRRVTRDIIGGDAYDKPKLYEFGDLPRNFNPNNINDIEESLYNMVLYKVLGDTVKNIGGCDYREFLDAEDTYFDGVVRNLCFELFNIMLDDILK